MKSVNQQTMKYEPFLKWFTNLPKEWQLLRLKYILTIENGKDYKEVYDPDGDIPVMGSGGKFSTCNRYLYDLPSVLFGRKGTIDVPLFIDKPFWTVDTMYYSRIKCGYDPKYIYYCATQFPYDYYQYGTALPSMTQTDLYSIKVPIPPLYEQCKKVKKLDLMCSKIDTIIEKSKQMIDKLTELKESIIVNAVTKGLDPNAPLKKSEIDWMGDIPKHWNVVKIKYYTDIRSGHTPDKKNDSYWEDGNIMWISLADCPSLRVNKYVSTSEFYTNQLGIENSSAELLPKESVILSRDVTVGLCAISTVDFAVSQHFMVYICGNQVFNQYLLYVFKAMKQELEKLSMGSTMPTIGLPLIKDLKMPLPPIDEQKIIAEKLSTTVEMIDSAISHWDEKIRKLTDYRKSVIYESITGKDEVIV